MKNCTFAVLSLSLGALTLSSLDACGDFLLKAEDGAVIAARSMEFDTPLNSRIIIHPKGQEGRSLTPDGSIGLEWTSRYGYVAADAFGLGYSVEGMNEEGLSFGCLWLPGSEYQQVPAGYKGPSIALEYIGDWVLGSFSSVAEVKDAFQKTRVWGHVIPVLGEIPPLHFAIHDAKGNNMVIEFIKGEAKIYDNPNTVLTNLPTFEWQLANLSNYVNLSPINAKPLDLGKSTIYPLAQGTGTLGIPGDWTPPSRFVRLSFQRGFAKQPETAFEGVNLAFHIFNTVDIPLGIIRKEMENLTNLEFTQWVMIKDLTNKTIYFRSYDDQNIKSIDFKKLDFNAHGKEKMFALNNEPQVIDVTHLLQTETVVEK